MTLKVLYEGKKDFIIRYYYNLLITRSIFIQFFMWLRTKQENIFKVCPLQEQSYYKPEVNSLVNSR